ncbi:acyl carrier protein [Mesorhizobium sp. L48C026A00]|uniref:acyl carrier protein n=1 Tax=Mesorhizobium sp. L48C026A00 TaxID=1287182 RepID=UPI0012EC4908|nr:hypothetical protein [Mesorhizobium sp. L48C026A00]
MQALDQTLRAFPLPGRFEPAMGPAEPQHPMPPDKSLVPAKPPKRPKMRLADLVRAVLHVIFRRDVGAGLAVLAAAILLPWIWTQFGPRAAVSDPPPCQVNCVARPPYQDTRPQSQPDSSRPSDPAQSARRRFLNVTIAAAEQYSFSISPYTLAEYYAGESDFVSEPALFLQAMLKRWPLPVYDPIPPTLAGAYALGQYSLAAAETDLAVGLDRERLRLGIDVAAQGTPDEESEGAATTLQARMEAVRLRQIRDGLFDVLGARTKVDPRTVTDQTRLNEDLGIYSGDGAYGIWDFVAALNRRFGITITDDQAQGVIYVRSGSGSDGDTGARVGATVADAVRVVAEALGGQDPRDAMRPVARQWPDWPRWLLFLPLLPGVGWAIVSAWRAALRSPPNDMRGTPVPIAARELARTAPKPARRLARQLSWHQPAPSGRLDVGRSISATLRRGGFSQPVFGTRSRTTEFLFLMPARRDNNHEAMRITRLLEALDAGGLVLHIYEYSPDPQTLVGASARSTQTGPLDLRALRELHPDARLVLVTDGQELVDYFSQRPFAFVQERLRVWPQRMLLTPVPMAEWGEREMNLSAALAAPIGRATAESFQDLAVGFGVRRMTRWRPPPPTATGDFDALVQRIQGWMKASGLLLKVTHSAAPRPEFVRHDEYAMLSDIPPPAEARGELVAELQAWLGGDGFYWLAGCAGYPQLRYAITVYLGNRLYGIRGPVYDEELLARLCLLPWFRHGRMPLWVREDLFSALPAGQRAAVDAALAAMLRSAKKIEAAAPAGDGGRASRNAIDRERALTIWLPDDAGEEIPPDEVIADPMLRQMPEVLPTLYLPVSFGMAFDRIRNILLARLAVVAAVGLWCWTMAWFWPISADAPHAPGAWLPLIVAAVVTVFGLLGIAVYRRLKSLGWLARGAPGSGAPKLVAPPGQEAVPMTIGTVVTAVREDRGEVVG